ncbi:hypothetical protein OHA79_45785 (plasmid) [Streptomyces sp. NBC_00841]|uniref:DUF6924 domain-containing protein n=1 Tax=unclassified Streptomyces TaxID=2593676 RepID=UPI00225B9299|nr:MULTISPECIES: hypothetical protein [unclassified Streptomyces]MCX4537746.1 hypothetical protein [Streptomyces sp. NBC_01669]WSA04949.1 hypothetical protein OHA79_45785 [Streptomyces sp. NBC_00841]
MRVLPEIVGRDEFAALIIRTDYNDEAAWQAAATGLTQPWGENGELEAHVHLIDDPAWADAAPDEVLTAVRRDENLSVVFVADCMTITRSREVDWQRALSEIQQMILRCLYSRHSDAGSASTTSNRSRRQRAMDCPIRGAAGWRVRAGGHRRDRQRASRPCCSGLAPLSREAG